MVKVVTSDVDMHKGGGPRIGNDKCHMMIEESMVVEGNYGTQVKVEMTALAPENLIGAKYTEFFGFTDKDGNHSPGAVKRFLLFCVKAGLMTLEQADAQAATGEIDIDETELVGRSVCVDFKLKPYKGQKAEHQGKSFPEMGFGVFSPLDKETDGWPKDPTIMAMLGGAPTNGENAPTPSTPPAAQSQQAPPPAQPPAGKTGGGWKDSFK